MPRPTVLALWRDLFERQTRTLLRLGYPAAADLTEKAFLRRVISPLEPALARASRRPGARHWTRPFLIVVRRHIVTPEQAIARVEVGGRTGFSVMDTADLDRFGSIPGLTPPAAPAYLLFDIEPGDATRNLTPDDALTVIHKAKRSPLTLEEGLALVTHHPDLLRKNYGYSLPGSRCGDRRVTALWISAKRPKLGWCWAGNPHTWLGFPSCDPRRNS